MVLVLVLSICNGDVNHTSNALSWIWLGVWRWELRERFDVLTVTWTESSKRERAARKACCSTSSLVSHSCWLMIWVKGMNIPCASGNCRMAACFALTRTGRWQRACKGLKGKKRRSMLKSGYLPTLILCSVVHSGSWFLLLFWWNVLRFPQRLPSFSEDSSHLQIDSTSWHDICHTPGNPPFNFNPVEDEAPVLRLLGRISYYRKPQVSFIKYPGSMA